MNQNQTSIENKATGQNITAKEDKKAVTHYGYNLTHIGHYMTPSAWIPVSQADLKATLEKHIDNTSRLARIWVRYSDDTFKCVYWYEQGQLTL